MEKFTGVEKAYNYHLSDWYGSDESAPVQPWGTYDGPDCGYELKALFAVEEWAVEGGFKYQ